MSVNAPTHERTRARILEVALELFAEQGFAATSTREISERLGFTKAALYYHFRTKDELLAALLAPALEELTRLTSANVDPAPAARRAILASYIDIVAANEALIRVLTQDPSVAHRPALDLHKALFSRLMQLLSGTDKPDTVQRTRVRAALGCIRTALVFADRNDDADVVRAATLAAACGALGIPGPRLSVS